MNQNQQRLTSSWLFTPVALIGGFYLAKMMLRRSRRQSVQGQVVLITGGSRGLGLALAREFLNHAARIAICARNTAELEAAARDLQNQGIEVKTFVCDLTDAQQARTLIDDVQAAMGSIDILINNAGTIVVGPVENMTSDDFKQAMDLNFWGAVHTTLAVAPKMKLAGKGRIVNIASIGGLVPVPHLAVYSASKFALVGFSTAMHNELAKSGITVTTVCPGLMQTGSPRNAFFKGRHEAEYAWFSIGDSLPGLSMNAQRAAKLVVDSTIHKDGLVTLGIPAKVAAMAYRVSPDISGLVLKGVNWLLPNGRPGESSRKAGRDSESTLTRILLWATGRRAERKYNQLGISAVDSQQMR